MATTDQHSEDLSRPVEYPVAVLSVVLHRDRPQLRGSQHVLSGVRTVRISRGNADPLRAVEEGKGHLEIEIDDSKVSHPHAALQLERSAWVLTDLDSTNGTLVNGEPLRGSRTLRDGDLIEIGRTFLVIRLDQPFWFPGDALDARGEAVPLYLGWQTFSLPLLHQLQDLLRLAPTTLHGLILGPTGVGKERIVQGIHHLSGRRGPLLALNCATFSEAMLDSELFGHARGAFTGAHQERRGLIEASSGGTLFLDEVADLPPTAQARLLRVVEAQEVRPLGMNISRKVDLRVVAATRWDLDARGFLPDLRYRLEGFTVHMPAIDQRREDLGLMVAEILGHGLLTFDPEAARALLLHTWPGGARELRQVLERLMALVADRRAHRVQLRDLPFGLPALEATEATSGFSREQLVAALQAAEGQVARAAQTLGCSRGYLYRLMETFRLDRSAFRSR